MTEYEKNRAVKCNYKKFSIIAKSNDEEIIGMILGILFGVFERNLY